MNKTKFFAIPILLFAFMNLSACSQITFISEAGKFIKGITVPSSNSVDFAGIALIDPDERYKVGAPYKIKGVWYYPKVDYNYVEEGIASWYGEPFHGRRTANGARYDMNEISAAHRTLPMPSIVRVTNLENGRSLVLKVNDRGPFAQNRIIDLSRRAAEILGTKRQGVALVRVEILAEESRQIAAYMKGEAPLPQNLAKLDESQKTKSFTMTPSQNNAPQPAPTTSIMVETDDGNITASKANQTTKQNTNQMPQDIGLRQDEMAVLRPYESANATAGLANFDNTPADIYVQAGAFSIYQNALKTKARIQTRDLKGNQIPVVIEQFNRSSTPLFRVRAGPVQDIALADHLLTILIDLGYNNAQIISDKGK